ncbi:hypothetical protein ILUMI_24989 [Ignelater luminosus]|uniref:Uncharacterized protein n=1 Tax=Ignelater luminosus TaxID=2038154 RepID=A0A8K0C837_IGNLU|nr:hypothetical protein ILUMI_24989 [Ignelater luminosus]
MLVNLWRITEVLAVDESTKNYTYNEIRESNINVKELEQYTLETNISDVSDTSASQLWWYPGTADSAHTSQYKYDAQNKSEKFKDLDVDIKTKILNGKIRIELRKNQRKNILHAKVNGNYDYKISDISLWIPIAKPSLETEKIVSFLLVSKSNFLCGWNALNCYRSNLWFSGSGDWLNGMIILPRQ